MMSMFRFMIVCCLLKDVDSESVEVFAEVGSVAVLPCKSNPQTVSPAVTWSNSKGSIWRMQRSGLRFWGLSWVSRADCPHTQFPNGNYNLHIQSVTEEDAGSYSCSLELDNVWRPLRTQVTLRVIKVTISPAAPIIGQSAWIRCSVSDGEDVSGGLSGGLSRGLSRTRVQWMLNTSPYPEEKTHSSGRVRGDGNTALRITTSERLSGKWTCVVRAKASEGRATALLEVKGIIKPQNDNTQIFAAVGSAVALPCVFSNKLTASSALWERLQNKITPRPSVEMLPPTFSALSPDSTRDKSAGLNEVSFEDAGRYRCSATVQGQRVERTMQLVTAKVEVSKEAASVKLTCRLSDPSSVTGYEWIHTTFDLNGTEFIGPGQKGQTVRASQTSGGVWTCRFYGQQGLLGNVTHHIHRMEGQSEDPVVRVSHGGVLVLVVLGLFILILLFILFQTYKNNQRSRRVLQFPALETILHNNSVEREMKGRSQTQK